MRESTSLEGGIDAEEASRGGADHWAAGQAEVDEGRRLKDLERQNARLKQAMAELTPDNQILEVQAQCV